MGWHELHAGAEWYNIDGADRTPWQRLAARSKGLVTPGNILTILGVILTLSGFAAFYHHAFWAAFWLVGIGRLCDILDGHVARHTHTSSPIGEGLDAFMDKVVILAGAIVLLAMHAVPYFLLLPVLGLQLLVAASVMLARQFRVRIHPSRLGKYSTFALWIAVLLYLARYLFAQAHQAETARHLYVVGNMLMLIVLAGSVLACGRYTGMIITQLLQKRRKHSL